MWDWWTSPFAAVKAATISRLVTNITMIAMIIVKPASERTRGGGEAGALGYWHGPSTIVASEAGEANANVTRLLNSTERLSARLLFWAPG